MPKAVSARTPGSPWSGPAARRPMCDAGIRRPEEKRRPGEGGAAKIPLEEEGGGRSGREEFSD